MDAVCLENPTTPTDATSLETKSTAFPESFIQRDAHEDASTTTAMDSSSAMKGTRLTYGFPKLPKLTDLLEENIDMEGTIVVDEAFPATEGLSTSPPLHERREHLFF